MKRAGSLLLVAAIAIVSSAHVGSPDAFFEGRVGPYRMHIRVTPPTVVPGVAQIYARSDDSDIRAITVRPVYWRAGPQGAPHGDTLKAIASEPGAYAGQLWLMSRGAYSVYVDVAGARGAHTVIVPVMAAATTRLGLSKTLIGILIALGVLLFAGLVAIVRAAASDSLVEPELEPDQNARRRGSLGAWIAVPIILVVILGGARWWKAEDTAYEDTLFRPLEASATFVTGPTTHLLRFAILDTSPIRLLTAPIMPDHGKLMHLFLVKESSMSAFAHLHPKREREDVFTTSIPAIPAGRYLAYGDIVLETGAEYTVTTKVDVPPAIEDTTADPDDGWDADSFGVPARPGALAHLNDNVDLRWETTDSLKAGRDLSLRFSVRNKRNELVPVEPYLGMAAHAVVIREDGAIFVHLHPTGTGTMAAQQAFEQRAAGDTLPNGRLRPMKAMAMVPQVTTNGRSRPVKASATATATEMLPGDFSFPYAFPTPGRYRVWVQVRISEVEPTGKVVSRVATADYEVIVR